MKKNKKFSFSSLTKFVSYCAGNALTFIFCVIIILVWLISGPYFGFNDSWQLIINTGTTIITFLMVFILQNSQNRETLAIQLKLDEIIRSMKSAHNQLLDIEQLSDEELEEIHKKYEQLAHHVKKRVKKGCKDTGTPPI